ncbi:MAG: PIN domain-containing protein [Burkholderiales bacterium]|nr:type II toxin-antitoxin system VapC family toxin [Zoogloeaceae bacterium]MBV6409974.1 hypothetical protein [Rhodocyclaceae bacterium]MCZ2174100.1 PIN domain-containing protein [Burkholderiales bacterium]HNQ57254.1 PIN domain-containing protein [Candidatus Desulfobacillus denitrificans]MCQ3923659.1 pilus assembly protein [Rhodocyclaceae bacterium]
MTSTAALVDTGFLVALFAKSDKHHRSAREFLAQAGNIRLHSIWPVVAEACHFLDTNGKAALLKWLERGTVAIHDIVVADLPAVRKTLEKYRNLDPDFTDAALVTLAGSLGITGIITVDCRDFSAYRIDNGQSFERLWL